MKTIIAGCRNVPNRLAARLVEDAIDACPWGEEITEILHGGASGVDSAAGYVCRGHWPVTVFPADWEKYGRSAGPIRNRLMASKADALIAVWDGRSRGTAHMIKEAERRGLRVYVHRMPED